MDVMYNHKSLMEKETEKEKGRKKRKGNIDIMHNIHWLL